MLRNIPWGSIMTETATHTPAAMTIEAAGQRYGWTRTFIYNELAAGRLEAVKAGRRTLILTESANRLLAALPPARFKPAKEAA